VVVLPNESIDMKLNNGLDTNVEVGNISGNVSMEKLSNSSANGRAEANKTSVNYHFGFTSGFDDGYKAGYNDGNSGKVYNVHFHVQNNKFYSITHLGGAGQDDNVTVGNVETLPRSEIEVSSGNGNGTKNFLDTTSSTIISEGIPLDGSSIINRREIYVSQNEAG